MTRSCLALGLISISCAVDVWHMGRVIGLCGPGRCSHAGSEDESCSVHYRPPTKGQITAPAIGFSQRITLPFASGDNSFQSLTVSDIYKQKVRVLVAWLALIHPFPSFLVHRGKLHDGYVCSVALVSCHSLFLGGPLHRRLRSIFLCTTDISKRPIDLRLLSQF